MHPHEDPQVSRGSRSSSPEPSPSWSGRWAGRLERCQVGLCLAAIGAGAVLAVALPGASSLAGAIEPVLALLLLATFAAVPFRRIRAALRDVRFLGVLLATDFLLVPLVVLVLSRPVAADPALLIGVLLVLLCPCVDYVIAFTAAAGGAAERLIAAAPLLMIGQILALPVLLRLFAWADAVAVIEPEPFVRAAVVLIVLPLAGALVLELLAGTAGVPTTSDPHRPGRSSRLLPRAARAVRAGLALAMVPLMVATLVLVVASQGRAVGAQARELLGVVPIFAAFAVVMTLLGVLVVRRARLDAPAGRAVVMSGVTRNSLVVLPLALALPEQLALAPLVVVAQTLVELVAMVLLVRLLPRLLPART